MKLFNYKPRHVFETDDDDNIIEEYCRTTFIVRESPSRTPTNVEDVAIEFVSGDKAEWDKMGSVNRTLAVESELTELSEIEVIVRMTQGI